MSKIFTCDYCSYITDRKTNMDRHQSNKHTIKKEIPENIFTCDKCCKQYKTKKHYNNHYKTCIGVNILTCPTCMVVFSSTSNKSRHIKSNTCKPRSIMHANNSYNTNTNSYNTINNITNNIYINDYKSERTDYISIEDIMRILKENSAAIAAYIDMKNFNIDFPENCNIKFVKYGSCLVKSNDIWTLQHIDDLTTKLYNLNYREVCDKIRSRELLFDVKEYGDLLNKLSYLNLELKLHNLDFIKKKIKQHKINVPDLSIYPKKSI